MNESSRYLYVNRYLCIRIYESSLVTRVCSSKGSILELEHDKTVCSRHSIDVILRVDRFGHMIRVRSWMLGSCSCMYVFCLQVMGVLLPYVWYNGIHNANVGWSALCKTPNAIPDHESVAVINTKIE